MEKKRSRLFRRTASAVLACLFAVTLPLGCSKKPENTEKDGKYILKNNDSFTVGAPEEPIDPAELYQTLSYSPEMFLGTYLLPGGNKALNSFRESSAWMTLPDDPELKLTALPFNLHAFRDDTDDMRNGFRMALSFLDEAGRSHIFECPFTVEGNKLICTILSYADAKPESGAETSSETAEKVPVETVLSFGFSFSGIDLTLTANDAAVLLRSGLFGNENPNFYLNCSVRNDSAVPDLFKGIEFHWNGANKTHLTLTAPDGKTVGKAAAELNENGLFTVSVKKSEDEKKVTAQYLFFYASQDAIVLADRNGVYFFMSSGKSTETEEETEPESEPETTPSTEELIRKKEDLIRDLTNAMKEAGIKTEPDPKSGELMLDSAVLFEGNSYELKENGKEALKKLIPVYASVVFTEEYEKFVSRIVIEGHSAPVEGVSYEGALGISQKRAETVRDFCLSSEIDLAPEILKKLSGTMEAIGKSNSEPILDKDGKPDKNASRRVTFRFEISD